MTPRSRHVVPDPGGLYRRSLGAGLGRGPARTRTGRLLLARQALYQMSYEPKNPAGLEPTSPRCRGAVAPSHLRAVPVALPRPQLRGLSAGSGGFEPPPPAPEAGMLPVAPAPKGGRRAPYPPARSTERS
jgi:hypothetical protein